MEKYFFYGITLLSLFIILVLMLFFVVTPRGRKSGNILISFLIMLFGIQVFYSFSVSNFGYSYFMESHKTLFLLRQSALLMGPLMYIYVKTFNKSFVINPNQLVHLLPFIAIVLFLLSYYTTKDHFILWESNLSNRFTIIIVLINLIYIAAALMYIRKSYKNESPLAGKLQRLSYVVWLQFILFGFIVLWIINLNISAIYMYSTNPGWCAFTRGVFMLAGFLFLCSVMFVLMLKPEIYLILEKYKSTTLNIDQMSSLKKDLVNYMNTHRPYLNPDISLELVAKDISTNSRQLSQVINESFNNNFNGYINEFRIRESLSQLSDTSCKKTILEILYDSGFNSKSAFYTEFKKHTNLTPLEYRANCLKELSLN